MQIGWLVVETFGRLARLSNAPRKPAQRQGDKDRPFSFSINESRSLDELVACVNLLHALCQSIGLDEIHPLPIPREKDLIKKLEGDGLDLDLLQGELETWSNHVRMALNSDLGPAAQAFFFGGGLANTFWHTILVWSDDKVLAEFLNFHRLDYLATQLELIAEELPENVADAIAHSLRKWSQVDIASADRTKLKKRLESQQEVWRDLLLEKKRPESYLREKHRRSIRVGAWGIQALFAIVVLLAIFGAGRQVGNLFPSDSSKDLPSFFAALSGFIVVIGGLFTQFSAWTKNIGIAIAEWMKKRIILRNTYRSHV